MIYRLRKKFIKICTLSFLSVFILLLGAMMTITNFQTTAALDTLADIVADSGGRFPDYDDLYTAPAEPPHGINQESPFTTRYFTVHYDAAGNLESIDIRSIASANRSDAEALAKEAVTSGKERGWLEDYRYKVVQDESGTDVIFISGAAERASNQRFLLAAVAVFVAGSLVVLLLIVLLSKRAVEPIADSYDKQKQFITDSSHELKTPLTLIRTNLDILESENGTSEWLDDIRTEADNMTQLVNRLVQLARMDEGVTPQPLQRFNLSDAVSEIADAFSPVIAQQGQTFQQTIASDVTLTGDERAIRQLIGILLDNACKYCAPKGTIVLHLSGGRHPTLTLDNTYSGAATIDTNRLFDRFYREDRARTAGSGFGLGLAIAKATCDKHHAAISAQAINQNTIRFKVRF
ncbi:MAG: HAMP domain-containing sensor histidine kinase [Peptococcaceae bacterium]|nr:HAMP domain-containing sensor histidine kinase [Peptococcaceae bacterium]